MAKPRDLARELIAAITNPYSPLLHPKFLLQLEAARSTLAFAKQHLSDAVLLNDRLEVLSYALERVSIRGLFLEFGVWTGATINHIAAARPNETIYGFDSFTGLPEDWKGYIATKGHFGIPKLPKVPANVQLVKGWFAETLPAFVDSHPTDEVAFLHVDSDIYSSAKTIFECLGKRIVPGTVIVFDEYFNYPNWEHHEHRAWQEFLVESSRRVRYLALGYHQLAALVEA